MEQKSKSREYHTEEFVDIRVYIKTREMDGLKTNKKRAFDKSTLQTRYTKCCNSCVTLERKSNKKTRLFVH